MKSANWLVRGAELPGLGIRDVRVAAGRIDAIAPTLAPHRGEMVVEARGNALIRGLHDHHIHLFATAAARCSTVCGPPGVRDEQALRLALRRSPDHGDGWIRGVAFHESVCDSLDRHWLDSACPHRPVRVQHRSGMLWVLNTRALERLGLRPEEPYPAGMELDAKGEPTGRCFGLDAWLGLRLGSARPSLAPLSAELARYGITGVTDAGAGNGVDAWRTLGDARRGGEFVQRLLVMGSEALDAVSVEAGDGMQVGPLKIYLRESALPALDDVARRIAGAHARGRNVAVHCVTRVELAVAIAAIEDAGARPGDRIEHAGVTDAYGLERLAALGLTVVTQPHFIAERGEQYLAQVEAEDIPLLYRAGAFRRCGVRLAAGSDAPYGCADPWYAMRAAVSRRTGNGVLIGVDEALSPAEALALYAGDPLAPGGPLCALGVGEAADLCLLDVPLQRQLADLDADHVVLTACAGDIAYSRL